MTAQETFYVTNTDNSGEGSLRQALSDTKSGGVIIVDESLKGDTIYLTNQLENTSVDGNAEVTIIGNGIVIAKIPQQITIPGIAFNRQYFTIENIIFDNIVITGSNPRGFVAKNCFFKSSSVSLSVRTYDYGSDFQFIGCQFVIDADNRDNLTISSSTRGVLKSYLTVTSCSFINTRGYSPIKCSYMEDREKPDFILTNNVFMVNDPEVPAVEAPIVISNGYNIMKGNWKVDDLKTHETDKINTRMKDPLILDEDGLYEVWSSGDAYQNFPANANQEIEGVEFPSEDILGNVIDYSQPTNSGSCQAFIDHTFVEGVSFEERDEFILIFIGEQIRSHQLNILVEPADATNKNVFWESKNEEIATVDPNGNVTALAEGVATIKVTTEEGGYEAEIDVIIQTAVYVETVTISQTEAELRVDQTLELTATVLPGEASYKGVIWTTSDENLATVEEGVVTAIAPGTVIITATSEDNEEISVSCEIFVPQDVTSLALNLTEKTLEVGEEVTLEATVLPADATYPEVTWESSDETIATVLEGVVTAVARGEATITATTVEGEFTAACVVTVEDKTVNIDTINQEKAVYPNPFNDYLIININEETVATIYELTGQVVMICQLNATTNRIDTAALLPGSYILKVGEQAIKIIK